MIRQTAVFLACFCIWFSCFPEETVYGRSITIHSGFSNTLDEKYSDYVDDDGLIKKPKELDESDQYGDSVYHSSWYYASLLIIKKKEPSTYERLRTERGVDLAAASKFLKYFRDKCFTNQYILCPKSTGSEFSGDQLAPLLYLLACANAFGDDECKQAAKDVLEKIMDHDKRRGGIMSKAKGLSGQILDNQRYIIDVVARMYDIRYSRGVERDWQKTAFTTTLKAMTSPALDKINEETAVFNSLALVSATCVKWGYKDEDVVDWRACYKQDADRGYGPSFRIVAGRTLSNGEIEKYYDAHIFCGQGGDNDLVLGQRPHRYVSGEYGPDKKKGPSNYLALDYLILKGLDLLWKCG